MNVIPTLLLILDGYGLAPASAGNAVALAKTPCLNTLIGLPEASRSGVIKLEASGRAVGLPAGYMGNSEVGHLNIGAGRVVWQDMTKIDVALEKGELANNPALQEVLHKVLQSKGRLHFLGLLSDAGVHSHIRHLEGLIRVALSAGVPVMLDLFTDGRDTPPDSGVKFVHMLQLMLESAKNATKNPNVKIGTLCGRFYAMDRDKRWDRVKVAWDMLVHGQATEFDDPEKALAASYARNETDEFVKPLRFGTSKETCVRDGDGLFFFNFRADRAREMVSAFHRADFTEFDRGKCPNLAALATMTSYDATLDVPVAFTKDNLPDTLGEVVSSLGLRQLRIAETEKYAHVTYFFNGGREQAFSNEDRILIDSPRDIPTYDLKPEMSILTVTEKLIAAWQQKVYNLVVCNFANPDMVGHTGNLTATINALHSVDSCVSKVLEAVKARGGRLILTADHGNSEEMLDSSGKPHTAHTCNPVPFLIFESTTGELLPLHGKGRLCDIAPTLLHLWGITPPSAMTGHSLINQAKK